MLGGWWFETPTEMRCREMREEKGDKSKEGGRSDRRLAPGEEVKFGGLDRESGWRREGARRCVHLRRQDLKKKRKKREGECGGEEMCSVSAKRRICQDDG